jgi:hypothetical protein
MNISRYYKYGILTGFIIIILCFFGAQHFTRLIDQSQRAELLRRAGYAALLVSPDDIATFTATEADLSNPVYQRIKNQFITFRSINPNVRFVYLMGYRPEVKMQFFYVDSEPVESEDYSPPGQLFVDTTQEDIDSYLRAEAYTYGPYTDSWGEWVSGNMPIKDAQGNIVAMLGVDIATSTWFKEIVFVRIAFATLALLLCIIVYFIVNRFYKKELSLKTLQEQNQNLKHHTSQLEILQSFAQLGEVTIYLKDKTVSVDERFSPLFSGRNKGVPLQELKSLIHSSDLPRFEQVLIEMYNKDTNFSWFDIRIGTKETGYRKYHFYGNVEHNSEGAVDRFSGIMQDITDIT